MIVPSVTVKDSAVSESASSAAVMVMLCVAPGRRVRRKRHRAQTWCRQVRTLSRIGAQRRAPSPPALPWRWPPTASP